jgi:hypothetical protein
MTSAYVLYCTVLYCTVLYDMMGCRQLVINDQLPPPPALACCVACMIK